MAALTTTTSSTPTHSPYTGSPSPSHSSSTSLSTSSNSASTSTATTTTSSPSANGMYEHAQTREFGHTLSVVRVGTNAQYLIGTQVAAMVERETFNMYRSMKIKKIALERAAPLQVDFLVRSGAVKPGTHSVTLVPYEEGLYFVADIMRRQQKFSRARTIVEVKPNERSFLAERPVLHRRKPRPWNVRRALPSPSGEPPASHACAHEQPAAHSHVPYPQHYYEHLQAHQHQQHYQYQHHNQQQHYQQQQPQQQQQQQQPPPHQQPQDSHSYHYQLSTLSPPSSALPPNTAHNVYPPSRSTTPHTYPSHHPTSTTLRAPPASAAFSSLPQDDHRAAPAPTHATERAPSPAAPPSHSPYPNAASSESAPLYYRRDTAETPRVAQLTPSQWTQSNASKKPNESQTPLLRMSLHSLTDPSSMSCELPPMATGSRAHQDLPLPRCAGTARFPALPSPWSGHSCGPLLSSFDAPSPDAAPQKQLPHVNFEAHFAGHSSSHSS